MSTNSMSDWRKGFPNDWWRSIILDPNEWRKSSDTINFTTYRTDADWWRSWRWSIALTEELRSVSIALNPDERRESAFAKYILIVVYTNCSIMYVLISIVNTFGTVILTPIKLC